MLRTEGDTRWSPPSLLLSPILALQHVQFVNLYNIENYRLLHYFGKLLTIFCDKNYSVYHILSLNSSSHLPISWCLLSTPPPPNIKVGPIIRIILVPPLASVNLRRERSQRGSGLGGAWAPQSITHPP